MSFLPSILAGIVIILALNAHIEQIRKSTEKETLAPIASMYGIHDDASKEEVYQQLSVALQDHDAASKARIAQKFGMEPDWKQIFDRIEKLSEPERNSMLHRIAVDFDFPMNTPLTVMKRELMAKTKKNKMPMKATALPMKAVLTPFVIPAPHSAPAN